jgi:O-antigen/teichoic acid export membrane protein
VTVTTRAAGAVAVVLSIAFLVVGGDILALFGPEFRAGAPAFAILVVGQLLNAITGPTGSMMFFGGFERRQALSVGVGAAVEMLLVALLVCPLGLAGAAIGSTVGQFVWNALMVLHVRRRLGIRTTVVGL